MRAVSGGKRESPLTAALRGVASGLLELVYPGGEAHCLLCGGEQCLGSLGLCGACEARLPAVRDACPRCGKPSGGCVCRLEPLLFDRSLAPYLHEGAARSIALLFKHENARYFAPAMAGAMLRCYERSGLPEPDALVPVPSTARRIRARGYYSVGALCAALGQAMGVPCRADILCRARDDGDQVGQNRRQRFQSVQGAFEAQGDVPPGAIVLLVDDTLTTGATASACAQALCSAGAQRVYAITYTTDP